MMTRLVSLLTLSFVFSMGFAAEPKMVEHNKLMDHGEGHLMDMEGGMVMGQNKDKLPPGCDKISEDAQFTVHAGHKYSKKFPGTMFAFDQQEWKVKPCARLTVTFINEDNIRHQWMMHGLPKFMYDKGMFHIEATGPSKISGTLILPKEDRTYLVHCDMAQHMEKGMKAQLVVGNGSASFPSIPGLTDPVIFDDYSAFAKPGEAAAPAATAPAQAVQTETGFFSGTLIIGLVLGLFGAPLLIHLCKERFKGMSATEIASFIFELCLVWLNRATLFIIWLYRQLMEKIKQRS